MSHSIEKAEEIFPDKKTDETIIEKFAQAHLVEAQAEVIKEEARKQKVENDIREATAKELKERNRVRELDNRRIENIKRLEAIDLEINPHKRERADYDEKILKLRIEQNDKPNNIDITEAEEEKNTQKEIEKIRKEIEELTNKKDVA